MPAAKPMQSSASEEISDSLGLQPGNTVTTSKASYEIVKILGEGGYGAVYKIKDKRDETKIYAMKAEPRNLRRQNKLKMEVDIMKLAGKERKESHFAQIVDNGKYAGIFVFVVMELLGPSLSDLKELCSHRIFPLATGLGVAIQSMEALEDLHKQGYIHRDIKPANCARGRGQKRHVIYVFDFGIARKMIGENGALKGPRSNVYFKGTVRYSSRRCHLNLDASYADDCESWLYMLLELISEGGLPWKHIEDAVQVWAMKQSCMGDKRELLAPKLKCREILLTILDYLDKLTFQSVPDYAYIYKLLRSAGKIAKVDIDAPYFWEDGKPSK